MVKCLRCHIEIVQVGEPLRWNDASRVGQSGSALCSRVSGKFMHRPELPNLQNPEAVERWLAS